jgi:hypothetical protein
VSSTSRSIGLMAEVTVVRAAARSNAEWCDAFCRTHGVAGRFGADCWTSAERTPPLYPDAVTLSPGVAPIRVLSEIDASAGCSVKDSFADLDLIPHGFRPLLHGDWLLWENGDAPVSSSPWLAIETGEQLEAWESAWGALPAGPAFFRPALLANTAITVFARYDDERIAAGAIANRSATVIGLGNLFDARGDLEAAWRGAARAVQARWGPMPVVSYESAEALEAAHQAGFGSVGELAVWMKPATTVTETSGCAAGRKDSPAQVSSRLSRSCA